MPSLAATVCAVLLTATCFAAAVEEKERRFWSFQPLKKPSPPAVRNVSWIRSPIDRFILARLEEKGLQPVPRADKRTLLRRLSFDLIGLPPSPEETEAFLADDSAQSFENLVDRLLASPRFGERWGRHWLDVARYAEDDIRGLSRESYPNAWRYRDWVIDAFNRDLPYDRFVKAQMAADLLPESERSGLLPALGFLGLGPWYYDIAPPTQARADERHERVDAVTRGFLGLTVACARCHDHKFDPISMRDYYAVAGVFANTEYREYALAPEDAVEKYHRLERQLRERESAVKEFVRKASDRTASSLAERTADYLLAARQEGTAAVPDLDQETLGRWRQYLDRPDHDHPFLKEWRSLQPDQVPAFASRFQELLIAAAGDKKAVDRANEEILAEVNKKKATRTTLPNGFVSYEDFCPGCQVEVKAVERDRYVLWNDVFGAGPRESPGRKGGILVYSDAEIDRWLAPGEKVELEALRAAVEASKKALPARYAYLHGVADQPEPADLRLHLRGSPYNLGEPTPRTFLEVLSSAEPSQFLRGSGRLELAEAIAGHPLAARVLVNRVWHHLFGEALQGTPGNFGRLGKRPTHPDLLEYLAARFVNNGMSVKSLIREIVLSETYRLSSNNSAANSAADPDNRLRWRANRRRLDVEAMRDALLAVSGRLDRSIGGPSVDLSTDRTRRTVYGKVSRFRLDPALELFDFPGAHATSESRNVTHVPLQRLFHLNSEFVREQAGRLAERAEKEAGEGDEARLGRAYALLFSREPNREEVRLGLEFLSEAQGDAPATAPAWQQLTQMLLSSNEFQFVD